MKGTLIVWALIATCLWSCGKPPSPVSPAGKAAIVSPSSQNGQKSGEPSANNGSVLELMTPSGSAMRFVDANGLQVYYSHVFKPSSYGYMHCKDKSPSDGTHCTQTIFTADERAEMGGFEMNSPEFGRGSQNVIPVESLTLAYMRTLREALGRECKNLVTTEFASFKAGNIAQNVFVKGLRPTQIDLDSFSRALLGITDAALAYNSGAADYLASFDAAVVGVEKKEDAIANAMIATCVAIAMDPLVILY